MYLSISARFTYKDKPKSYRGLSSSQINWNVKVSLYKLLRDIILEVISWHQALLTETELYDELTELRDWLIEFLKDD